jgi:small glutamine-rich tetratricopeptide repeat-containing protein alpha
MSGKSNPTTRRLAASIVKFLSDSTKNGSLDTDDAESMEVAIGIISDSFALDQYGHETPNLQQVFEVYEKTLERMVPTIRPPLT